MSKVTKIIPRPCRHSRQVEKREEGGKKGPPHFQFPFLPCQCLWQGRSTHTTKTHINANKKRNLPCVLRIVVQQANYKGGVELGRGINEADESFFLSFFSSSEAGKLGCATVRALGTKGRIFIPLFSFSVSRNIPKWEGDVFGVRK